MKQQVQENFITIKKTTIIDLIELTSPLYSLTTEDLVEKYGKYTERYDERWDFKQEKLSKLSENELQELYKVCSKSWDDKYFLNTKTKR